MAFTQTWKGTYRHKTNINLIIFEHVNQSSGVCEYQLYITTDRLQLESMYKWLRIQVTYRSNPYFPVHQDCRNFAASYTNPLV